jgi:hypothetical protein
MSRPQNWFVGQPAFLRFFLIVIAELFSNRDGEITITGRLRLREGSDAFLNRNRVRNRNLVLAFRPIHHCLKFNYISFESNFTYRNRKADPLLGPA